MEQRPCSTAEQYFCKSNVDIADSRTFEDRLILRLPREEETVRVMISGLSEVEPSGVSIRRRATLGEKCHGRHTRLVAGIIHQSTARQHSII